MEHFKQIAELSTSDILDGVKIPKIKGFDITVNWHGNEIIVSNDKGYKFYIKTTIPPLNPNGITWRINWSKIDPRANFVAVDSDGGVFAYDENPKPLRTIFAATEESRFSFLFEIGQRPDWETLIFERPVKAIGRCILHL